MTTKACLPHQLYLNVQRLSPFGQLAWLRLAVVAAESARANIVIHISRSSLSESVLAVCLDTGFSHLLFGLHLTDDELPELSSSEPFVFLSSSAVFSTKLLERFTLVSIEPDAPPVLLASSVYWHLFSHAEVQAGLAAMVAALNEQDADAEYRDFFSNVRPAEFRVSLLTSVFNGDTYISGFLSNMAELEQYDRCEHFLIRPGSKGNEHSQLIEHVRHHSAAVYVNLISDPGLYEVWNMGARLANGRYLSNANLDDRRAPDQITVLADVLDNSRKIDVVSTALRVSETRNMTWDESTLAPIMFADQKDSTYTVGDLIKSTHDGLAARNLPHCMPVWRRQLHATYGWFNERAYGPSADWEFWLRVGRGGIKFCFFSEPLGLYLKDEGSYWRRSDRTNIFERRILAEYGVLHADSRPQQRNLYPLSLDIAVLPILADYGAWLEWINRWLLCVYRAQQTHNSTAMELLQRYGRKYLNLETLPHLGTLTISCLDPLGLTFNFLIDLLHQQQWCAVDNPDVVCLLHHAVVDGYNCSGDVRWLVTLAFLQRKAGNTVAETRVLQKLEEQDAAAFWTSLQDCYRFSVPLSELVKKIGKLDVADGLTTDNGRLNVWYFPTYVRNEYQRLLYRDTKKSDCVVHAIKSVDELDGISPITGMENILHIHWLDAAWKKDATPPEVMSLGRTFLAQLKQIQKLGVQVFWTVHNTLSHRCVDPEGEIALRRSLFELADRVYIHHPLVVELVDWLSFHPKLRVLEHGSYEQIKSPRLNNTIDRLTAGLRDDNLRLLHFGQILPYKDLHRWLPGILHQMEADTRLYFVLAGRINCIATQTILAEGSNERLTVHDGFVPQGELDNFALAADFVFLSYRQILTSGSLFQAFSWGVPVIAPRSGTIPVYVVEGWNGFTYTDNEDLDQIITRCLAMSRAERALMAENAYQTAKSLHWLFP